MELTCATSEAASLTKSLVALRSTPGMEAISVTLRNPSKEMALFPLFSSEEQPDFSTFKRVEEKS
jgi:hypothetical protein